MQVARSVRELRTYRKAMDGATTIYQLTRDFPKEETYSLTSQICRSSQAVTALLAEAWARRRYRAAFINKLDEALGEAIETQVWLEHALNCNFITRITFTELDNLWAHVGGMLSAMINRADDFCKNAPDHNYMAEESQFYGDSTARILSADQL